jgi:hypothetical protein
MKEWDAPESNKTEAGVKLTRNIPSTTLGVLLGDFSINVHRLASCIALLSLVGLRSSSAASAGSALGCVEGSSLGKRWHSDQALRT